MIKHFATSLRVTIVSVVLLGLIYPLVMTALAQAIFPRQANGSLVTINGKVVGSTIIGQLWTKPQYFHGRPSAAGKGYDPTATGGTNYGPTSKKLIDSTKATIAQLKKDNPGCERAPADGSRDLQRQRDRSRHHSRKRRTGKRRALRMRAT